MQQKIIAGILEKIHMSDLPALAENMAEFRSLTQDNHATTPSLVSIFLKDFALICKILRTVNSPYYKRPRTISSVSVAINTLGLEELTSQGTDIMILEDCVKTGLEQDLAVEQISLAVLSAVFAQNLAIDKKIPVSSEEVYVASLLRCLGKITVILYHSYLYQEIAEMEKRGASEEEAAWSVLRGLTLAGLGGEIARSWNYPDSLVRAIEQPADQPSLTLDQESHSINLSIFSNGFVHAVCRNQNVNKLLGIFGDIFKIDKEEALNSLNNSVVLTKGLSKIYQIGLRNTQIQSAINLMLKSAKAGSVHAVRSPANHHKADGASDNTSEDFFPRPPKGFDISTSYDLRPNSINDYIHVLHGLLRDPLDIRKYLILLITALYKAIEVDRVIIMHVVPGTSGGKSLAGGLGIGDSPAGKIIVFEDNLAESTHIATACLRDGRDRILVPGMKIGTLTTNLTSLIQDRKAYLLPLIVSQRPMGILYLDRKINRASLSRNRFENVQFCRDMAIQAINKSPQSFQSLIKLKK
ncbi:HDOD domain-containing protein [Thermodesulfobacteriota bacterium]